MEEDAGFHPDSNYPPKPKMNFRNDATAPYSLEDICACAEDRLLQNPERFVVPGLKREGWPVPPSLLMNL